jgi:predicted TIM-barrel fold metal-dependent hydrolase
MMIDMHTHPFGPPSYRDLFDKIATVPDLVAFRTRYPELYDARQTEQFVDYADAMIADMDRQGIELAIIQNTGGSNTNELAARAAAKYPGRLFALFRIGQDQEAGGYVEDPSEIRTSAPEQIQYCVKELGMIGMGEIMVRAFTTELHPEKIARDLKPVMEATADLGIPIMIPTGWSQFPGQLYFADPTYVDELAGRYPTVPIILNKMGRGIDHYFEVSLMLAMRNQNIYFDTLTTTTVHLKRAVDAIGAERIMFGTDWSPTWRCVREPADLYTLRLRPILEANLSDHQREQILWRTAVQLFRLPIGCETRK